MGRRSTGNWGRTGEEEKEPQSKRTYSRTEYVRMYVRTYVFKCTHTQSNPTLRQTSLRSAERFPSQRKARPQPSPVPWSSKSS